MMGARPINDIAVTFDIDGFGFISTRKDTLTRNEFKELLDLSEWNSKVLVLFNINLRNVDLSNMEINFVNFINGDFTNTSFNGSSLKCVLFDRSFMFKSTFSESELMHVVFSKSNVSHAMMNGIELSDVRFVEGTNMFGITTDSNGLDHLLRSDCRDTIHAEITSIDIGLKLIKGN